MESGAISDSQISASSQYWSNHAARQGRLHYKETRFNSGAWAAGANNLNQWLQIDLGQVTKVTRVATQGRNYSPSWPFGPHLQYVTKYQLQYSNGGNFQYYSGPGSSTGKVSTHFSPRCWLNWQGFLRVCWYFFYSVISQTLRPGCHIANFLYSK